MDAVKSEALLAGEPNECPDLQPSIIPPVRSMYKNISCIWPKMRTSLGRVWLVDLLVAVRVLPLQFASLLLVTLPITMPRLLALQLANPASVVEGAQPKPRPRLDACCGYAGGPAVSCGSAASQLGLAACRARGR